MAKPKALTLHHRPDSKSGTADMFSHIREQSEDNETLLQIINPESNRI